jgi:hypothetical protein
MALDAKLIARLEKALATVDEQGSAGLRLRSDAARLWRRVQRFLQLDVIAPGADVDALRLACYALQLPMRQSRQIPVGKLGRTNLRDRAEQAAELLVTLVGEHVDEALLDRCTRLLHEAPQKAPMLDEARLLADALNLDDFGVVGLLQQAIQQARQGDGVVEIAGGLEKREQYGYWDARLRDGFHFEPVRQMARRRLDNARATARLLLAELEEDERK